MFYSARCASRPLQALNAVIHVVHTVLRCQTVQVYPPDFVAQAAGHLDWDNYVSNLGLNPKYKEAFKEMVSLLWTTLKSQVEQIKQVGQTISRRHVRNCCSNEN